MSVEEATARVLDVLNELQIPYMLVGAFAVNFIDRRGCRRNQVAMV